MTCDDYERHELPLSCAHAASGSTQVQVRFADGCSARLCTDCEERIGAARWGDVAERLTGPARGLDLLQLLRAAGST